MEKRALIAVVLSLIVLLGSQYFFAKRMPRQPVTPQPKQEQKTVPPSTLPEKGKAAPQPLPPSRGVAEKIVKIETPLYSAEFSSRGAVVNSWMLKKYVDRKGLPIGLIKAAAEIAPLSIGNDTSFKLRTALFKVTGGDLILTPSNPEGTLVFTYADNEVAVRRTLKFHSDSYRVDVTDEVRKTGGYWMTLGEDFGITSEAGAHTGPVILSGTNRQEYKPSKLKEPKTFSPEELKWVAVEDKYFFTAVVPLSPVSEIKLWEVRDQGLIGLRMKEGISKYVFYAGPKDIDQLTALNLNNLQYIVDFGLFSIIARPIFWFLKWVNNFVGNWGWSIIVLTVLIRIPFIPLLNKGQKSMKKLQELQPKMNEIKARFKKDPQRMQREMMELYRKYKVNPMGGCLPILIQIPVFFALYKVLLIAIELRGAPWVLWIHDLSAKDPYYILPIIMGITMLIQQRMTPSSADPTQQKIMLFMPIIFTFMFLNFASGLVLYWLVSNLLSIVQQFFVNKAVAREREQTG